MVDAQAHIEAVGSHEIDGVGAGSLFRQSLKGLARTKTELDESSWFTISELADRFGLTPRSLRFYEEKGMLSPRRMGGWRMYGPHEVERLKLILMGKRVGLSIVEIADILAIHDKGLSEAQFLQCFMDKLEVQSAFLKAQERELRQAQGELESTRAVARDLMLARRSTATIR
jgi:DNA-binding transcriptional MerR regulator